jgi:hypothetical protein
VSYEGKLIKELSNKVANVYEHNRKEIAPERAHIITFTPDEKLDALQVFKTASARQLRTLFVTVADTKKPSLILFHYGTKNTNNKLSSFHIHRISGELADEFKYIAKEKTYVPHPRDGLASFIQREYGKSKDFLIVENLSCEGMAEAKEHRLIVNPVFASLGALAKYGTDQQIKQFSYALQLLLNPPSEGGNEGYRVIFDEFHNPTGCLTAHVLGGENLAQNNSKKRWFEYPAQAV